MEETFSGMFSQICRGKISILTSMEKIKPAIALLIILCTG